MLLPHPTRRSTADVRALRFDAGKSHALREPPMLDGRSTRNMYVLLRRTAARGCRPVVLILDKAHYHHAWVYRHGRDTFEPRF